MELGLLTRCLATARCILQRARPLNSRLCQAFQPSQNR